MNDLRSPLEDRPSYRQPPTPPSSFGQRQYDAEPSFFGTKFNQFRQNKYFPLASVLAAVVVFGTIISYAYDQGSQSGVNATTPIVQASNEDYKSRPENPGGMDVPFQDAVVFDQLQSSGQTAANDKIESLLPAPETPVATTESTEAATTTAATEASETKQAVQDSIQQATQTTVPTQPEESTTTTQEIASAKATDEIAKKMDSVAPAATQPAAKIESGAYRVQLGAFRDEPAARAAWKKFQNQFNSQLAGVTPDFPRADLGAKGTFYRVQGVNLSKASAEQICGSINAAKSGSCLVTK
jgi:cell division septation protein DedD